jgi:hypothetical protein
MSRDPGDEWYVRSRGKVLGPFDFRQLEILRNQKRLAKFDEVSRGDRRSWAVASTFPELFPTAGSVGAAPDAGAGEGDYSIEALPEIEPPSWYYMTPQGSSPLMTLSGMIRLVGSGVVQPETLVWTADMPDWMPARSVPALGVFRPAAPSAATASSEVPAPTVAAKPQGGTGFSVASFILGLLGLMSGILAFVIPTVVYGSSRNRELVGIVFIVVLVIWAVLGFLSVTFGTIGMGISGLILGILSLTGLAILIFIATLGIVALDR